jgi:hypothetical protein
MDDKELSAKFAHIASDMISMRAELLAAKSVITALIATHQDKAALAKRYALISENLIAHILSTPYPESLADAIRKEHERWRERLDKTSQGTDQGNQ